MSEHDLLEKTNRINMLFDFYASLLTEKQRHVLEYYYHENYSLAKISELMDISRQGVYEHISRAETLLEQYEQNLGLLDKRYHRIACIEHLEEAVAHVEGPGKNTIVEQLKQLKQWI